MWQIAKLRTWGKRQYMGRLEDSKKLPTRKEGICNFNSSSRKRLLFCWERRVPTYLSRRALVSNNLGGRRAKLSISLPEIILTNVKKLFFREKRQREKQPKRSDGKKKNAWVFPTVSKRKKKKQGCSMTEAQQKKKLSCERKEGSQNYRSDREKTKRKIWGY